MDEQVSNYWKNVCFIALNCYSKKINESHCDSEGVFSLTMRKNQI